LVWPFVPYFGGPFVLADFGNSIRNPIVPDVEKENNEVELQTMSMYEQPNPCHTNTSLEGMVNLKEKEKKESYKLTSPTSL